MGEGKEEGELGVGGGVGVSGMKEQDKKLMEKKHDKRKKKKSGL